MLDAKENGCRKLSNFLYAGKNPIRLILDTRSRL